MSTSNIQLAKSKTRERARRVRAAIPRQQTSSHLIGHWPVHHFSGKLIAGYWPIKDEIDPRLLMKVLSDEGHTIALPAITKVNNPLEFRKWTSSTDLVVGPYKTLQPSREMNVVIPDVIFVPLLAFNAKGDRLGYGGGFYDRTLFQLRQIKSVFACGVAFSAQEIRRLPTDKFDQKLDGILTESYFRTF